jgi:thymidylate synthase
LNLSGLILDFILNCNKDTNMIDHEYQQLLRHILKHGIEKKDRTGTGTKSIFGWQIRHDMKEGFPLLTTKKMYFKGIVAELLWFLRGDINIKFLLDNNCHIWNGDAIKNYEKKTGRPVDWGPFVTKEEAFVEAMKDEEFAKQWGDLGPIYGKQWRRWSSFEQNTKVNGVYSEYMIDQIQNLINELKTNPDSRRLMVNAWNVGELDQMVLPPCHYGFQVYTRELSISERVNLFMQGKKVARFLEKITVKNLDEENIPTRAISLMWNQRSVDTFLGLPFNIASYALLLEILAEIVNMVPDQLIGNLGDTHLYLNHLEQAEEQLGKLLTPEERSELLKNAMGEKNYSSAIKELMPFGGGLSEYYDIYEIPRKTREPLKLPRLLINTEFWAPGTEDGCGMGPGTYTESFQSLIEGIEVNDFQLEGYKSHPAIKAPLSN